VPILISILAGVALSYSWNLHEGLLSTCFTFVSAALFCITSAQEKHAKKLSYLIGITSVAIAFSWLYATIIRFGGFPSILALGIFVLFVLGSALCFPIATHFHSSFKKHLSLLERFGILLPLCFVAVEKVPFVIFPWKWGHGILGVPQLTQIADIGGASFLTFFVLVFGESIRQFRTNKKPTFLFLILFIAIWSYGTFSLKSFASSENNFLVSVVQANVSIENKHNVAMFEDNLNRYIELSSSISKNSQLVIWPESVMTNWVPDSLSFKKDDPRMQNFPNGNFIFGALTFESEDKYFNSALGINSKGEVFRPYHKQILMPFGEFMPFSKRFPWVKLLNPVAADFTAGLREEIFDFGNNIKASPLICYEDIVPEMSARAVLAGATILVNITNDAWFGDTMAPYQHQRIAAFRAIENRRFLIRSTNSGVTSIISPTGEVIKSLPTFSDGILETNVYPINSITWYSGLGAENVPHILFYLGVLGCLIQYFRRKF